VLSMEGVGGKYNIFDFDDFELTNSNRLSYSLFDIGLSKIFLSAREVWERNPFIEINIFSEGFNDVPEHGEAIRESDLIIDECDSFKIKILLRNLAKKHSKALLMHTSERGITDIERHDIQSTLIFNGLLEGVDLNNPSEVLTSIINPNIVSPRMLQSFSEIGKSLKSWPQLASEVVAGGANITTIARWVLLGENIKSGRYFLNCDSVRD
jgi:ThiF family